MDSGGSVDYDWPQSVIYKKHNFTICSQPIQSYNLFPIKLEKILVCVLQPDLMPT